MPVLGVGREDSNSQAEWSGNWHFKFVFFSVLVELQLSPLSSLDLTFSPYPLPTTPPKGHVAAPFHPQMFWFYPETFSPTPRYPGLLVILASPSPLFFYLPLCSLFFSSPWPSFTTCPLHYFLSLALSPSLFLCSPPCLFCTSPVSFGNSLSLWKIFPLHPTFTQTANKRFSNFDEDGPVKLLLSNL